MTFAWAIGTVLRNYSLGWRPESLKKIELNAVEDPFARTIDIEE